MKGPVYLGGMILSDMDTAYRYELALKRTIERRFDKYKRNWGFHLGMETLFKIRKGAGLYKRKDIHPLPGDTLIYIDHEAIYWEYLRLKSKKLNILRLEVYKYYRRHGRYPI